MDRREALKKMAVGGVGIVGATAVMSSTAFAYSEPTSVSPPTFAYVGQIPWYVYNSKIELNFTTGSATCPGSAKTTGGTKLVSFEAKLTSATLNKPSGSNLNSFAVRQINWPFAYGTNPVGNYVTLVPRKTSEYDPGNPLNGYSLYLVKTNSAGNSHGDNTRWTNGDQLVFKLKIGWACVYKDNTQSGTRFDYYTGTATYSSGAWSKTVLTSSGA